MTSFELLDLVHDRESFLAFAFALAEERRVAEGIEAVTDQPVDASDTCLEQNLQ